MGACGMGYEYEQTMALSRSIEGFATTVGDSPQNELEECDACPFCNDTCDDIDTCIACQKKLNSMHARSCRRNNDGWLVGALSSMNIMSQEKDQPTMYTMCQLRRHNHADSAWILVGDEIYDATPYIKNHPGGTQTILKKAGGAVDCTEDLRFHSKRAQREWKRFRIGTLRRCRCKHAR